MRKLRLARFSALLIATMCSACASLAGTTGSQPLIVLLTDFGERDHYVGALKGAVYRADPDARIEDITHDITKFYVTEGAYTLAEAAREYPDGTIFIAIVDPGVGSTRKAIAIKTRNRKIFIGPDNGILAAAAHEAGVIEAREITNRSLMHSGSISNTFHGRDIFGPVAGHVARGVPFDRIGPVIPGFMELPAPPASRDENSASGYIIHVDDYGNLLTNVPISMVEALGLKLGSTARIIIGGKRLEARYVRTYSDVEPGAALFVRNKDFVEVAINRDNLASRMELNQGMKIRIER